MGDEVMDIRAALLYARISMGVYTYNFGNLKDFQFTAKFENKGTHTQGAFGIAYGDTFVVAFRGSEETRIEDWITDLKFIQQVYPYDESNNKKVKVHFGFIWAYKSVREAVLRGAKDTAAQKIATTGHSLGAGLATLAALDIQYNTGKEVACYTYGSPKVGNRAFADSYNRRVPKTYRIVNRFDVVPLIPPIGYVHVGELHHLGANSLEDALANKVADHLPVNYINSLSA